MNITFSFDEKVQAISLLQIVGLTQATRILSRSKKIPSAAMREELEKMSFKCFVIESGLIEITDAKVLQFVEFNCPQQPNLLTKEFFDSQKLPIQQAMLEAFSILHCKDLLQKFKPYRITQSYKLQPLVGT